MTEIDLLVRAEFLYPVSEGMPIVPDGEVAIAGGRIVHAGPRRPEGTWQAKRTLDGAGRAVLPGFVNCHSHAGSLVFRSQTDDHAAKAALLEVAFRFEKDVSEEEWGLLAEAGCADMLCAGITTINDIWYAPGRLAAAVEACGLRAQIAHKVFDVRLHELWRGDYTHHAAIGEERLRHGVAFAEQWHGAANGRITARIGTHATDTCAPEFLRAARAEANRLGVGMHIHVAQSIAEVEQVRAVHGCGTVEFLRDTGMLGPDVVMAHLVFATDADLDAAAESGAAYAHCPTIYPRRGRYPALEGILARGIPTGFATDWMMNDPFEGMRNALNAMRLRLASPEAMTCAQALAFHTIGAARVMGLQDEIGSLEPGKKADLIMVDIDRPHLQPYYGGYPALVYYARASDVVTSVIDGEIVVEDGRPTRLDREGTMARIREAVPGWRGRLAALGSRAVFGPGCPCCG